MSLEFENKKHIRVLKGGINHNCVGVNVVKDGVTYNVWGSKSSVIYVVDTNESYSENVTVGDSVLSPTSFTPTKEGYTFVGWRMDKTPSEDVLTSKTMGDAPITLYAVFKRTLTLTYYDNSTTPSTKTGVQYYNNGNNANPSFTVIQSDKDGWTTRGWSVDTKGDATLKFSKIVTISSDLTVYGCYFKQCALTAISRSKHYTHRIYAYYNSSGETQDASWELPVGSEYEGWSWRGWTTEEKADADVMYSSGDTVSNGTDDLTVYGLYEQTITLSYDGNGSTGGSVPSQSYTRYYNAKGIYSNSAIFTLSDNGFSKTGYRFSKWAMGSIEGTQYDVGSTGILTESTTFYAVWIYVGGEINVFSATFEENFGAMTFEETNRSLDSNYLSSVMTKLSCGASQDETNTNEATILGLTSKAKSEYKYVTITFRALLYVYYGSVKATVCGEVLYDSDKIGDFYTYTKKFAISNTNWKAVLQSHNGSSEYGCDNNLAVQSVVLSVS